MGRRRSRNRRPALLVGLAIAAIALSGSPAQAGPPPVAPPDAAPAQPGPPRSQILAADPATVPAPDTVSAMAAATTCPTAPYGVQNTAPGTGKTVALTFDDGPGPSTQPIMDILRQEGVTATFFNVGVNEAVRPGLVRAQARQGLLLANHTWSHPDMTTLSSAAQAREMDAMTSQQAGLVGSAPCFFRPPYGAYNGTTLSLAQARRMAVYNWSVDTEDWKAEGSSSSFWVDRIIRLAQAGGSQSHPVILMHNQARANPATVAALPAIIDFYRDRGYRFVDLAGRSLTTEQVVTGDWDGDGYDTPGVVRGNTWYLRNSNSTGPADAVFVYGSLGDRAVVGDWDGNGTTTVGVVRGNVWKLRNSNSAGYAHTTFVYGATTDRVVTGDWDRNGTTTPGLVRGNTWKLRNSNTAGYPHVEFVYGATTDRAVTGDWDGNGTTTPGVIRGNTWKLRNSNTAGYPHVEFVYGATTDRAVTGDWDRNRTTTPGVVRGTTWKLRNSNDGGYPHVEFVFTR